MKLIYNWALDFSCHMSHPWVSLLSMGGLDFPLLPFSTWSWTLSTSLSLCLYYSLNSPPHALNKLFHTIPSFDWSLREKGCPLRHPLPYTSPHPHRTYSYTHLSFYNHNRYIPNIHFLPASYNTLSLLCLSLRHLSSSPPTWLIDFNTFQTQWQTHVYLLYSVSS